MAYLEYRVEDGYVVAIHEEEPSVEKGYAVAESDGFAPGDEFAFRIVVMETDEGRATKVASVRYAPQAKEMLEAIDEIRRAGGAKGEPERGVSPRLDAIEDRLDALEAEERA